MRLVSQRLLRSISGSSGLSSCIPSQPHSIFGATVPSAQNPPQVALGTTQSPLQHRTPSPLFQARSTSSALSPALRSCPPPELSTVPYPHQYLDTLLLRRNLSSVTQQTRLFHAAGGFTGDERASSREDAGGGTFTGLFSRKVVWVVGFIAGMVLGAGVRLSTGWSLKPGVDPSMIAVPDEEEDEGESGGNTLLPAVKASKGFLSRTTPDDEANNNTSGEEGSGGLIKGLLGGNGKGSGPPKHRAHFNFIADVVERLAPSVVFIEILDLRRTDSSGSPLPINNGSGFVVDAAGYVLTNAHVVTNRPRASRVMVRLHDGREMAGSLEELDPYSDLALIKINASDLVPAPLGESSNIRPGEFVVAVGAPLSLSNTVTAGVVSSVSRCARDLGIRTNDINYIQTDAAITFGNSGGPLANLDGDVIGINSMKATAGISFAIPVDTAKEFLAKAAAKKKMLLTKRDSSPSSPGRRAYLGITMLSLTKEIITELQSRAASPLPPDLVHGVLVWRVVIGSPAYHAGLQPGDVITQVNGHVIQAAADVYRLLEKPSDLTMVVLRGNNRYSVTVTPEE